MRAQHSDSGAALELVGAALAAKLAFDMHEPGNAGVALLDLHERTSNLLLRLAQPEGTPK